MKRLRICLGHLTPGFPQARHGFTLVELLVVIAIVALLASLMLPGLARAREYAYFTTCKSNLRQIAIGLTIYASDNKGKAPTSHYLPFQGGDYSQRCFGGGTMQGIRRIGQHEQWLTSCAGQNSSWITLGLYYDDTYPGRLWNDESQNGLWRGRPRQPGKYLNLEVLWDPIVIVRDWKYAADGSRPVGSEEQRDAATRTVGVMGYMLFIQPTGCYKYQTTGWGNHILNHPDGVAGPYSAEEPYRPATRNRNITMSCKGSVWFASCHLPKTDTVRTNRSHFGGAKALLEMFKFNTVHLDGHVGGGPWLECWLQSTDTSDAWGSWQAGSWSGHPYGWAFKNNVGADGLADEPTFDGAFDENR